MPVPNPVTGRITVAFIYPEVADTSNDFWDLNAAFGQGSIWMLAPLGGNEIVRISTTSGNPVSRVYPGGSCSQYCMQVYAIAGAVWEPTERTRALALPARPRRPRLRGQIQPMAARDRPGRRGIIGG